MPSEGGLALNRHGVIPMSEEPRRPRRSSMPSIFWWLVGALLVAVFVLALGLLNPVGAHL